MRAKNILLVVITAALCIQQWQEVSRTVGIDFYHYWGVSKANQFSHGELHSPYRQRAQYATALAEHAEGSSDDRLKTVTQYRRDRLYLTGTPLFYSVFAPLPGSYTTALHTFQTLQILAFLASTMILGYVCCRRKWEFLTLAFLLIASYKPLEADLIVGNFNSLQLLTLVLVTCFAGFVVKHQSTDRAVVLSAAFFFALIFVTLLKPNVGLITLLLGCCVWMSFGTKVVIKALIASAPFAAILIAIPCIQFSSWTVWLDWYRYLTGAGGDHLVYPVAKGNYATVLLVVEALDVGTWTAGLFVGLILVLSLFAAMMFSRPTGRPVRQRVIDLCVRILQDPIMCTAVGVTATLALSPLVWHHYYILSLLPALWLLSISEHGRLPGVAGGLSILLTSGIVIEILAKHWEAWQKMWPYGCAVGWLPLWGALLVILATRNCTETGANSRTAARK